MLTGVTITGADDRVDPVALAHLSEEFPFVEWGILASETRAGTPRYPTKAWVDTLGAGRYAVHLCGAMARDVLEGNGAVIASAPLRFGRIQVNGYKPGWPSFLHLVRVWTGRRLILQVRSEDQLQAAANEVAEMGSSGRAEILFDPSGGRGIETFRWPATPIGVPMGFAGGIKPSNMLDVLSEIGPRDAPFWIDMESGVRSGEDTFDLRLVREVLERAAPFVVKGP
ncbi:MAG TPA: hypothetical protein VGI39_01425 [Polyangiaceae bacterium]|jgi:hypothetical protein